MLSEGPRRRWMISTVQAIANGLLRRIFLSVSAAKSLSDARRALRISASVSPPNKLSISAACASSAEAGGVVLAVSRMATSPEFSSAAITSGQFNSAM